MLIVVKKEYEGIFEAIIIPSPAAHKPPVTIKAESQGAMLEEADKVIALLASRLDPEGVLL